MHWLMAVSAVHLLGGLRLARYVLDGNQEGLTEYFAADELQPSTADAQSFLADCCETGVRTVLNINGVALSQIDQQICDVMTETVYVALTGLRHGWFNFVSIVQVVLSAGSEWWTSDCTTKTRYVTLGSGVCDCLILCMGAATCLGT